MSAVLASEDSNSSWESSPSLQPRSDRQRWKNSSQQPRFEPTLVNVRPLPTTISHSSARVIAVLKNYKRQAEKKSFNVYMYTLKFSFVVGAQWMIWTIGIFLQLVSHKLSSANVCTFVSDFHKLNGFTHAHACAHTCQVLERAAISRKSIITRKIKNACWSLFSTHTYTVICAASTQARTCTHNQI